MPASGVPAVADVSIGFLWILAIAGIESYGVILAGWSSNNNYSLLGALRSSAQMISYELPMGIFLVSILILAGGFSLVSLVEEPRAPWEWIWLWLMFPLFFICILAETNRSPFDLPETENELVSGFITEYGGIKFALYFIAEYTAMVVNSAILATVYLGGWKWPAFLSSLHPLVGLGLFAAKVLFVLFLFVWIRASLPRVRFDKFMKFSWKFMLPLALANLLVTAVVVVLV